MPISKYYFLFIDFESFLWARASRNYSLLFFLNHCYFSLLLFDAYFFFAHLCTLRSSFQWAEFSFYESLFLFDLMNFLLHLTSKNLDFFLILFPFIFSCPTFLSFELFYCWPFLHEAVVLSLVRGLSSAHFYPSVCYW